MTQTVAIAPEIDDPDRRYSGVLRATRAEAQNLQRLLEDIDLTGQIAEPGAREVALRLALREAEPVFEFNRGQIAQLLAAASDIMNNDPRMFGSHGDELVHAPINGRKLPPSTVTDRPACMSTSILWPLVIRIITLTIAPTPPAIRATTKGWVGTSCMCNNPPTASARTASTKAPSGIPTR
jgi:hypothetical protein